MPTSEYLNKKSKKRASSVQAHSTNEYRQNDEDILQQVANQFIWQGHIKAIERASRRGQFAVSFRAAGEPTLKALSQGAAAKGHDILEKTIKPGSIKNAYGEEKAPQIIKQVRDAGIEGYVGHWDKESRELLGIYMSSGHGLSDDQVNGKIYPIDLNNLDASLSALKAKENWAALPFTGDYDMHDMILFAGRPHSVPSESPDEKRIIKFINEEIAKSDTNRPFNKLEHNVIRHGPQVNYPAFALDKEKEETKNRGGLFKAVAEPGEFPVAIVSKGKWSIAKNINELEQFYNSIGAKMKTPWKPDDGNFGYFPNAEKPWLVNINSKQKTNPEKPWLANRK
ncbi:Insecticial toxin [Xenorhabdus griffiniae]|uniref:Insecticial toxin n=1 Tax=Xenorhabdus griffiniae TaxID=351672 RepID=UPI0023599483|nr:Insecticial toxin [Xenorhabdus griffiniae]MDC9604132.1 Insecticial toxin [Xenorhabdus griffiniae]